jgi:hypothetical protein
VAASELRGPLTSLGWSCSHCRVRLSFFAMCHSSSVCAGSAARGSFCRLATNVVGQAIAECPVQVLGFLPLLPGRT